MVNTITDSTSVTAAFAQTIILNGNSVHVLHEGNGSQWWEMIAIYGALKIPLLPSLCQCLAKELRGCYKANELEKEKKEVCVRVDMLFVPWIMNSLIFCLTFNDSWLNLREQVTCVTTYNFYRWNYMW